MPLTWAESDVQGVAAEIKPGYASGEHNDQARGVPHLRPMNISRDGRLDMSEVKYVKDSSIVRVRQGDVLFNNTNSPVLVGKTAFVGLHGELAFSNHMTRIVPSEGVDAK